jgi:C4-dicarboxylate transporter, DctM subunit
LLPTVQAAGIDLIWFGIFVVIVVEMAQITPPVGFNLFVLQGMTKKEITYIARVTLPFFFIMMGMVLLLWFAPQIATYLPQKMLTTV